MAGSAPAIARVGFDAIRALRNSTGLGNYSRGVLSGLQEVSPATELHLYSPRAPRSEFAAFPKSVGGLVHLPRAGFHRPVAREWWRTFRLGRVAARDGMQLYHGLTHEIPRDLPGTGIPSVVTVHDLLFETHPEFFSAIDRRSYSWRYRWSAERASIVVAVSQWTRQQLHEHFGIPLERIAVVPPARDPRFALVAPEAARAVVRDRYGIPAHFILSVGTFETRKNHVLALEALARLKNDARHLVLVGRDGGTEAFLRERISTLGLQQKVQIVTDVSDTDLPVLTQCAAVALYLSRAEGFGMPIIEAMSAGVPVIAARGPHLKEAGGEAAVYIDGDDADALADLLRPDSHLWRPPEAHAHAARRHAETFESAPLARRLLRVYDAVMTGQALSADLLMFRPDNLAPADTEIST